MPVTSAKSTALHARCIDCGYALRDLAENRCPECGRAFDPHDSLSMDTPQYRQRIRTAGWVPGLLFGSTFVALFMLFIFFPRLFYRYNFSLSESRLVFVCCISGFLLFAWLLRTRARRSILGTLSDPKRASERWGRRLIGLTILLVIVTGGGGLHSWTCPHGRSMSVGPIVFTRDSDRGPCRNYVWIVWTHRLYGDTFISIADG